MQPNRKPAMPNFSSGPCAKRPGWSPAALANASLGRSHRSAEGKARLLKAIEETREVLGVPDDYRIAIVPASDTGAVEMALWSLLGARGVDVMAWESFGAGWATDINKQLKLDDARLLDADYGLLPDLAQVNFERDVVFCWNGTTSGVRLPHGDWIPDDRAGLTICDATSAAFAMELPWRKLDVVTFSWQKVLGGEAAHGMLILGPRAVARLESHTPAWPLPKIFRLTKGGKLTEGPFKGETINTPSMLCVEDYLDTLNWAKSVGGLQGLIERVNGNAAVLSDWVAKTNWVDYVARDETNRSTTSVCLSIVDAWFTALSQADGNAVAKQLVALLEAEGAALDIGGHRDAPTGLRIWCGATVERTDLEDLTPWLDWAYGEVKANFSPAN
ncbi:MAG: phosphoserine transaminase [Rhodospirillaceae bacterium]|jgi:phosphoserine aminotransferase|nr:phosphoserine transaminase [Rhodospirillaceae bacterium]MBT3493014.1 phosphoserine transaminase [Rhodospirillaceae bacterium]MBT3782259.1 phosphoserine transaminase [Rhodospirillaceae bacterium]MBT3977778.1 phosphoserine transaminase [Rhodospirillaceae bacterium]MBT4170900.1 phosphoserine transaminase [Rhodospirillaceae bacterium]